MYKILFILFILFIQSCLSANTLHFKEQRYIYSIDTSFYKKGVIEFLDNQIITSYTNSDSTLIYTTDTLIIKNSQETKEIDLDTNIPIKIFFLLLKAIYENNQIILEQFFTISQEDTTFTLTPKTSISNYISNVQYKKTSILEFLTIELVNQDRIIIEEIH